MTDDEWESQLAEIRLSHASEKLDDRMETLFAGGRRRPRTSWLLPLLGATCALGAVLIVFSHPQPAARPAMAITIVRPHFTQSQTRMVRLLLEAPRSSRPPPEFTVSIATK